VYKMIRSQAGQAGYVSDFYPNGPSLTPARGNLPKKNHLVCLTWSRTAKFTLKIAALYTLLVRCPTILQNLPCVPGTRTQEDTHILRFDASSLDWWRYIIALVMLHHRFVDATLLFRWCFIIAFDTLRISCEKLRKWKKG